MTPESGRGKVPPSDPLAGRGWPDQCKWLALNRTMGCVQPRNLCIWQMLLKGNIISWSSAPWFMGLVSQDPPIMVVSSRLLS